MKPPRTIRGTTQNASAHSGDANRGKVAMATMVPLVAAGHAFVPRFAHLSPSVRILL